MAYQFYDSTLNFLDQELSNLTKDKYQSMLKIKNFFYKEQDLKTQIYKKLGIIDSGPEKEVVRHEFALNNNNN